jgi:superoxide dismutase
MWSGYEPPADPAEGIAAWKREEQRTAAELSRRIAAFNPSGARLLADWVPVFDYTARCAEYWVQTRALRAAQAGGFAAIPEPYGRSLFEAACAQTEAFASHLDRLADGARIVGRAEEADALAQAAGAAREKLRESAETARPYWQKWQAKRIWPVPGVGADDPGPEHGGTADGSEVRRVYGRSENGIQDDGWTDGGQAGGRKDDDQADVRKDGDHADDRQNGDQPGSLRSGQAGGGADEAPADLVRSDGRESAGRPGSGRPEPDEADAGSDRDAPRRFGTNPDRAVPIGGHTLPPLPYAYDALEPYIDEATMRIHHDRHHRAYVDGLNRAELALREARASGRFDLVKHWERELAFNGAGHYLHTIFWNVMSPQGGGRPKGALARAIDESFGGFEAFRRQFSAAAEQVEGGGWAILVWSPRSGRLEILQAEKHQNLSQWDAVPLLPLDVWEHAYYLKHQNRRADYIRDWWNVVNWPYVEERFAKASQLRWEPY